MRPFPKSFDPHAWRTKPTTPTHTLNDGEEIDLGDRVLTVLHTPGHTTDSICLLDRRQKILFSGDTVDTGPIYAHLETSDFETFIKSVRRLADEVSPLIDTIFTAHGARYRAYPDFLPRVADAFSMVQEGGRTFEPTKDCFLTPVKHACFNDFSIVVPNEFEPLVA